MGLSYISLFGFVGPVAFVIVQRIDGHLKFKCSQHAPFWPSSGWLPVGAA